MKNLHFHMTTSSFKEIRNWQLLHGNMWFFCYLTNVDDEVAIPAPSCRSIFRFIINSFYWYFVILPYQICKEKNRCVFHDEVYQLINPNITSSHLKRNSITSFLQSQIFFVLKYFIWSQFSSVYFIPYQFHATYHITTI